MNFNEKNHPEVDSVYYFEQDSLHIKQMQENCL